MSTVCRRSSLISIGIRSQARLLYGDRIIPKGHNALARFLAMTPLYDWIYWLGDLAWRGDKCSAALLVRNRIVPLFERQNEAFHDMPTGRQMSFYVPEPDYSFHREVSQ